MIVVDANVVAYLFFEPLYLPQLQSLAARDADWIAPTLWRSEFRNVLARYLRNGKITMNLAVALMAAAEDRLGSQEYLPASAHILTLAQASGCSAYDCEYVSLAREMDTYLITYDNRVIAAFPTVAMTPVTFLTVAR